MAPRTITATVNTRTDGLLVIAADGDRLSLTARARFTPTRHISVDRHEFDAALRSCQQRDDGSPLDALALLPVERAAIEARIRELVAASRELGTSWAQIGLALGISRQAAHERYG